LPASSRSTPLSRLWPISQPPPTALASAPLIPFISCADRCTVLGPQRIRLPAHYLDCTVAYTTALLILQYTHTLRRPPPPPRPAQTLTWAPTPSGGMSFPLRPRCMKRARMRARPWNRGARQSWAQVGAGGAVDSRAQQAAPSCSATYATASPRARKSSHPFTIKHTSLSSQPAR